jgi:hypothetical protein
MSNGDEESEGYVIPMSDGNEESAFGNTRRFATADFSSRLCGSWK